MAPRSSEPRSSDGGARPHCRPSSLGSPLRWAKVYALDGAHPRIVGRCIVVTLRLARQREGGGSGGNRTPSAGKDLIYNQEQPPSICLRPVARCPPSGTSDSSTPNEGKPRGSGVSRTPCPSEHALGSSQARASLDSASDSNRRRPARCAVAAPNPRPRGSTLFSRQVRSRDRFSFREKCPGLDDRLGAGRRRAPDAPRPHATLSEPSARLQYGSHVGRISEWVTGSDGATERPDGLRGSLRRRMPASSGERPPFLSLHA